jgi:fumarate reductase flavoprotein subunit
VSTHESPCVLPPDGIHFEITVPVVVVGAGACGLIAAMAAQEAGAEVLVLERDPVPFGSTGLSSGMIPAAGTLAQHRKGVEDTPEALINDIMAKNRGMARADLVDAIARASGPTVDWLSEVRGVPLELVEGFLYPGTSRMRMHAPPEVSGTALMTSLQRAVEESGIQILTDAQVTTLFATTEGRIAGVRIRRPDGSEETIGSDALILACNGFGGNPDMVRRFISEMKDALYFGHPGNQGEALIWGETLGAATEHLGSYQGHGSVAQPHSILITWALIMEGGIQVNATGKRFSNEHLGYSEQAFLVLKQPGGVAWNIYDARLHELGLGFEDYRQAQASGAIVQAPTVKELAETLGLPAGLEKTVGEIQELARKGEVCPFGRSFKNQRPLEPPYCGVQVTGALFHTQGGLMTDVEGRVLFLDGHRFPNLFAGGGAACGISGPESWGYLSGNGLLMASTLGRLSGLAAARILSGS